MLSTAPPKSPKLIQTTTAKETPLLGEEGLVESNSPKSDKATQKEDAMQKKLDDLDALLWDNALGEAEKMGSEVPEEVEQKRHKNRRAKQHAAPTLQGIGKGAGLTPMKMGAHRTVDK